MTNRQGFTTKKDAFEYNRLGIVLTILFLYQNTEEKSCMKKQKKIKSVS